MPAAREIRHLANPGPALLSGLSKRAGSGGLNPRDHTSSFESHRANVQQAHRAISAGAIVAIVLVVSFVFASVIGIVCILRRRRNINKQKPSDLATYEPGPSSQAPPPPYNNGMTYNTGGYSSPYASMPPYRHGNERSDTVSVSKPEEVHCHGERHVPYEAHGVSGSHNGHSSHAGYDGGLHSTSLSHSGGGGGSDFGSSGGGGGGFSSSGGGMSSTN